MTEAAVELRDGSVELTEPQRKPEAKEARASNAAEDAAEEALEVNTAPSPILSVSAAKKPFVLNLTKALKDALLKDRQENKLYISAEHVTNTNKDVPRNEILICRKKKAAFSQEEKAAFPEKDYIPAFEQFYKKEELADYVRVGPLLAGVEECNMAEKAVQIMERLNGVTIDPRLRAYIKQGFHQGGFSWKAYVDFLGRAEALGYLLGAVANGGATRAIKIEKVSTDFVEFEENITFFFLYPKFGQSNITPIEIRIPEPQKPLFNVKCKYRIKVGAAGEFIQEIISSTLTGYVAEEGPLRDLVQRCKANLNPASTAEALQPPPKPTLQSPPKPTSYLLSLFNTLYMPALLTLLAFSVFLGFKGIFVILGSLALTQWVAFSLTTLSLILISHQIARVKSFSSEFEMLPMGDIAAVFNGDYSDTEQGIRRFAADLRPHLECAKNILSRKDVTYPLELTNGGFSIERDYIILRDFFATNSNIWLLKQDQSYGNDFLTLLGRVSQVTYTNPRDKERLARVKNLSSRKGVILTLFLLASLVGCVIPLFLVITGATSPWLIPLALSSGLFCLGLTDYTLNRISDSPFASGAAISVIVFTLAVIGEIARLAGVSVFGLTTPIFAAIMLGSVASVGVFAYLINREGVKRGRVGQDGERSVRVLKIALMFAIPVMAFQFGSLVPLPSFVVLAAAGFAEYLLFKSLVQTNFVSDIFTKRETLTTVGVTLLKLAVTAEMVLLLFANSTFLGPEAITMLPVLLVVALMPLFAGGLNTLFEKAIPDNGLKLGSVAISKRRISLVGELLVSAIFFLPALFIPGGESVLALTVLGIAVGANMVLRVVEKRNAWVLEDLVVVHPPNAAVAVSELKGAGIRGEDSMSSIVSDTPTPSPFASDSDSETVADLTTPRDSLSSTPPGGTPDTKSRAITASTSASASVSASGTPGDSSPAASSPSLSRRSSAEGIQKKPATLDLTGSAFTSGILIGDLESAPSGGGGGSHASTPTGERSDSSPLLSLPGTPLGLNSPATFTRGPAEILDLDAGVPDKKNSTLGTPKGRSITFFLPHEQLVPQQPNPGATPECIGQGSGSASPVPERKGDGSSLELEESEEHSSDGP